MASDLYAAVHHSSCQKGTFKISRFIADVPPRGLESVVDNWPNGKKIFRNFFLKFIYLKILYR